MESQTKNKKTRAELQAMVQRAFPGLTLAAAEDAVTELKEGWFNVAYDLRLSDGRNVILKIAPPHSADVMTYEHGIMTTEVNAMRLVAAHPGIPVPHIYAFDTTLDLCDAPYFFMEKLKGVNYEHIRQTITPAEKAQIEREIGQIIHAVNTFEGSYFGYEGNPDLRASTWPEAFLKICDVLLADGQRKHAELPVPYETVQSLMHAHAAALAEVSQPRLVHWDAWDSNFFVAEGHISGILDFERAIWGDPLMEAQFRALAFGGITESLRAYGKTTFIPAEDVRNHLYTLYLALVMKIECYYRNYDTDDVANFSAAMLVSVVQWLQAHS
jgi:aminoglycoside phosphotransferase (APT) family kinase protein